MTTLALEHQGVAAPAASPALHVASSPSTGAPGTTVRELTTMAQLSALRDGWSELATDAVDGSLYLTPDFLASWWEAFADGDLSARLAALALTEGDRLIALVPLMRRAERYLGLPIEVVRCVGNAHSMRRGALCHPGDEATLAWHTASWLAHSKADVAFFEEVRTHSPMTASLRGALEAAGFVVAIRSGAESAYVDFASCGGTFDGYRQWIGRKARQNLDRKARHAESHQRARYTLVTRATDTTDLFNDIATIARASWSFRHGTSIVSHPAAELFYRRLVARAGAAGTLFSIVLHLNDRPAAYSIGVRHRDVVYCLKTAYDEGVRSASPGCVLQRFLLAQALAEGVREVDFAGHLQPYKEELCTGIRSHVTLCAYPRRSPALLEHLVNDHLRPRVRRSFVAPLWRRWRDAQAQRKLPAPMARENPSTG
jgi:CelD/BcsL family acetyltransferase involved in cellulose biosynthesis